MEEEECEGEEKEEESHAEKKKRKYDEDIAKLEKAREVLKAVLSVDSNSNQESEVNPMEMIAQGYAASESEEEDGEVDHEETKISYSEGMDPLSITRGCARQLCGLRHLYLALQM
jgi:hypothetical protein